MTKGSPRSNRHRSNRRVYRQSGLILEPRTAVDVGAGLTTSVKLLLCADRIKLFGPAGRNDAPTFQSYTCSWHGSTVR